MCACVCEIVCVVCECVRKSEAVCVSKDECLGERKGVG